MQIIVWVTSYILWGTKKGWVLPSHISGFPRPIFKVERPIERSFSQLHVSAGQNTVKWRMRPSNANHCPSDIIHALGCQDEMGSQRGCCVPPKERGEEAPGLSTVRGAPQNGDGPDHADVALMRLVALPRHTKKVKQQKDQSRAHAFEPTTIRSKICGPSISAISESTNACGKKSIKSCRCPPRSARLAVRKGVVRLNKLE